jgi:Excinuclease ATPase subunit
MRRPALQPGNAGGEVQRMFDCGSAGNSSVGGFTDSGEHPTGSAEIADTGGCRARVSASRAIRGHAVWGRGATDQARARIEQRQTGRTLYLLDEPTTGLHFDDVRKLLDVLHRLTDLGNTVIIIEHNLDVIRNADWIIDLGPEGGEEGGRIVAQGTPEQVTRNKKSYTGQALAQYFATDTSRRKSEKPDVEANLIA